MTPWRLVRDVKAVVVGRGMESLRVTRRGRMSSMVSSDGGWVKGENMG